MKTFFIFLLIFISICTYADTIKVSAQINQHGQIIEKDTVTHEKLFFITLKGTESSNEKMPWIVALLIGFSSVFVNIFIAKKQQKSNIETINKQIDNAKYIANLDFNRSVKSQNRMDWINTVRCTCSDLVANLESLNIDFINAKLIGNTREFKLNQRYSIEISRLATKLELLLNPNEEKTVIALDHLKKLSENIINANQVDEFYIRNAYKHDEACFLGTIKLILKEEWERVKSGL